MIAQVQLHKSCCERDSLRLDERIGMRIEVLLFGLISVLACLPPGAASAEAQNSARDCREEYQSRRAELDKAGIGAPAFIHQCWWHTAKGAPTNVSHLGTSTAARSEGPGRAQQEALPAAQDGKGQGTARAVRARQAVMHTSVSRRSRHATRARRHRALVARLARLEHHLCEIVAGAGHHARFGVAGDRLEAALSPLESRENRRMRARLASGRRSIAWSPVSVGSKVSRRGSLCTCPTVIVVMSTPHGENAFVCERLGEVDWGSWFAGGALPIPLDFIR